jgi:membrane protein implicated in regulation of membrane protease activity
MNDETARRRAEVVDEVSKWTVGAGILMVALAPLAIPILVLTGVALLPLLIPAIPIALIAGVVYVPVKIFRRVRRRRKESVRRRPAEEEVFVAVELAPANHPLVK